MNVMIELLPTLRFFFLIEFHELFKTYPLPFSLYFHAIILIPLNELYVGTEAIGILTACPLYVTIPHIPIIQQCMQYCMLTYAMNSS